MLATAGGKEIEKALLQVFKFFLELDDELESRTTQMQEGEDDEDINPSDTTTTPPPTGLLYCHRTLIEKGYDCLASGRRGGYDCLATGRRRLSTTRGLVVEGYDCITSGRRISSTARGRSVWRSDYLVVDHINLVLRHLTLGRGPCIHYWATLGYLGRPPPWPIWSPRVWGCRRPSLCLL